MLRKHWKSCQPRLITNVGIPVGDNGGRRKQACDRCAAKKRACDKELPCTTCITSHQHCTYDRLVRAEDRESGTFEDKVFPTVSRAELIDQSLPEESFDRSTGAGQNLRMSQPHMDRHFSKTTIPHI